MAAPMKWSSEMESILIDEIKEKRHIWDHKNKYYKLRTLKKASYEEIAKKMSLLYPEFPGMFTVATLISKFANLKTVYQRNKKKLHSLPSGSGSAGFTLPWTHFNQMKFLDDVEPVEPSTSNLNEACESSQVIYVYISGIKLSLQDISDNEAVDDPLSCSLLSINEPFEVLADVPPNPVVSRKRKRTNPRPICY
ncbi:unnamed protein product [Larinioides sclopetarius]|uniref:MADF domain-containing protein n=1 Tax=Larinioides sclopetarius TaxID=280406 RepID=A0AAV2ANI0_9ARAC